MGDTFLPCDRICCHSVSVDTVTELAPAAGHLMWPAAWLECDPEQVMKLPLSPVSWLLTTPLCGLHGEMYKCVVVAAPALVQIPHVARRVLTNESTLCK